MKLEPLHSTFRSSKPSEPEILRKSKSLHFWQCEVNPDHQILSQCRNNNLRTDILGRETKCRAIYSKFTEKGMFRIQQLRVSRYDNPKNRKITDEREWEQIGILYLYRGRC